MGFVIVIVFTVLLWTAVVSCSGLFGLAECVPHRAPTMHSASRVTSFDALRARLGWALSVLVFATLVLALVVLCGRALYNSVPFDRKRNDLETYAAWLLAGAVLLAFFLHDSYTFNRPLFDFSIYELQPDSTGWPPVVSAVTVTEVLAGVGLLALVVAVTAVLVGARNDRINAGAQDVAHAASVLRDTQREIRVLLYAGAVALIAGTVQVSALYSWALSMVRSPDPYYSAASAIPQSMAMLSGTIYSFMLAVIFLPAFLHLRVTAERVALSARPEASPKERNDWLVGNEISASLPRTLTAMVAILAPMLAGGPLALLLELITKGS